MPVPTQFGVFASTGAGAAFYGIATYTATGTSQAITFPSGTAKDDIAFIQIPWQGGSANTASITGGDGGWTKATQVDGGGFGSYAACFTKKLETGDLAGVTVSVPGLSGATPPFNEFTVIVVIYRGCNAATLKSSASSANAADTLSLTGFTKNAASKGLVSIVTERDPSAAFVPPGTFTARGSYVTDTIWRGRAADILNPSNYVDGTAVVWTDFGTTFFQTGFLYELT